MARSELRTHPKFKRLVRRLELPVPYVVGLLECLWQCGYATGSPLIGDCVDVELAAEWPGPSGVLFDALLAERWIDHIGGRYWIHDLYDHAPEYVRKRMDRRKLSTEPKDLPPKTADNGVQSLPNGSSTQPNPTNRTEEPPLPPLDFADLIPAAMRCPEFDSAWRDWSQHRRDKGAKLTAKAVEKQMKKLAGWDVTRVVSAIEHSIACGYQGLFEEGNGKAKPRTSPKGQWSNGKYCPG